MRSAKKKAHVAKKGEKPSFKSFLYTLRKKRIIEILAGFIGGGWLILEFVHWILIDHYHFPEQSLDITFITLICVLICTLIWRFFGGKEKKTKRIKVEFILIPLVILITAFFDVLLIQQIGKPEAETISETRWKNSIAVLPFTNISPEEGQEYFCDGLTEELINRLSNIKELKVPARTSAFAFKGERIDIRDVGQKLNVDKVLEGSVRKIGNRIRITAQLINVADGYHLWSEKYDRKLEDVFAIQDEISLAIVNKLKVKLFGEERARLVKRYTENLEAYNFYLRGRYFSNKHTEAGYKKSIEYFEKAINLDKTYALAYAGLAHCYKELSRVFYLSRKEGYPKAKEALMKALELDETLGEAYAILASIMFISDWDMSGPEEVFQRAIKFSPGSVNVYKLYAQYLTWTGKHDEAIAIAKRAVELDPLTPLTNGWLGFVYFYANRYDKSIDQYGSILELEPNFVWAHVYLAHNYTMKGMYAEAIVHADKVQSLSPSLYQYVGCNYAKLGEKEKARKILGQLLDPSDEGAFDPITVATVYAGLDEKEKAFYWLNKGYEARSGLMVYLKAYGQTFLKNLSSDPRYIELLNKMGFKK